MKFPLRSVLRAGAVRLWRDWARPLAIPLLVIASAKSALADLNYVPTGSMKPTIAEGDLVFIDKLAYDLRVPFTFARLARWSDPARGDIVVCFSPADGARLVKRVIALPGDTVEMRDEILFINGVRQIATPLADDAAALRDLSAEDRANGIFARETLANFAPRHHRTHAVMALPRRPALRSFAPVTIPAGSYFVLGDNRDNSHDSRFYGVVPRHAIIGEARAVVASVDLARWWRPRFHRFFTALE